MSEQTTVVIACAGEGSRLGLAKTKALVEIMGVPLIGLNLRMLRDVAQIRIVVGYQANQVIDYVSALRPDVVFVHNDEYRTTGTADSLSKASEGLSGNIVSLDGDLLVHPEDFYRVLKSEEPCLGVLSSTSDDPVHVVMGEKGVATQAIGFTRGPGDVEWSGLFKAPVSYIRKARGMGLARGHVYQMLEPSLPMAVLNIRACEIDTPNDFERAVAWFQPLAHLWGAHDQG